MGILYEVPSKNPGTFCVGAEFLANSKHDNLIPTSLFVQLSQILAFLFRLFPHPPHIPPFILSKCHPHHPTPYVIWAWWTSLTGYVADLEPLHGVRDSRWLPLEGWFADGESFPLRTSAYELFAYKLCPLRTSWVRNFCYANFCRSEDNSMRTLSHTNLCIQTSAYQLFFFTKFFHPWASSYRTSCIRTVSVTKFWMRTLCGTNWTINWTFSITNLVQY